MKRLLNQFLSTVQLALWRTWTALGSHVAVALGVLAATTTICALLLYAEAVSVAQAEYVFRARNPLYDKVMRRLAG